MKFQNPNPKIQTNSKRQIPKGASARRHAFGIWDLELVWDLDFGIWDFGRAA
jgi:hypothetical protein